MSEVTQILDGALTEIKDTRGNSAIEVDGEDHWSATLHVDMMRARRGRSEVAVMPSPFFVGNMNYSYFYKEFPSEEEGYEYIITMPRKVTSSWLKRQGFKTRK